MKTLKAGLGCIIVRVTLSAIELSEVTRGRGSPVRSLRGSVGSLSETNSPRALKCEDSFEPTTLIGAVHLVLVQARGLIPPDGGDMINPYCKISMGNKKRKSKVCSQSPNPKWREGFDLPWYEDSDCFLEISIYNFTEGNEQNERIGRAHVDVRNLAREASQNIWLPIDDMVKGLNSENLLDVEREGQVNVIVTISGTGEGQTDSGSGGRDKELTDRYDLKRTLDEMQDVGVLKVRVVEAEGLSPEYVWKRNPFVVLEVGNCRIQTFAKKGTTEPVWNQELSLEIKDIFDVLEVSVLDCNDSDNWKTEFLGKVEIPLLNIVSGCEKWFRLKDELLRTPAKGTSPRILLQMNLHFNKLRACSRALKQKQIKYEINEDDTFKFATFKLQALRVKKIKENCANLGNRIKSLFAWEDPFKSFYAMLILPVVIWHYDSWMLPFGPLLLLTFQLALPSKEEQNTLVGQLPAEVSDQENEEDERTVIERLDALQQKVHEMQKGLEQVASVFERLANLFNFTVPLISWFTLALLLMLTFLLYVIPLRVIMIIWTLNKFRKGLLKRGDNNSKLRNILSRVPDKEQLKSYQELTEYKYIKKKSLMTLRKFASEDSAII